MKINYSVAFNVTSFFLLLFAFQSNKLNSNICFLSVSEVYATISTTHLQKTDSCFRDKTKISGEVADTNQVSELKKTDTALLDKMKALFISSILKKEKGEIVLINIIDNDWIIERQKITGAILHRYVRSDIIVKANKTCWLYQLVTFKQDYKKNAYAELYLDETINRIEISCKEL